MSQYHRPPPRPLATASSSIPPRDSLLLSAPTATPHPQRSSADDEALEFFIIPPRPSTFAGRPPTSNLRSSSPYRSRYASTSYGPTSSPWASATTASPRMPLHDGVGRFQSPSAPSTSAVLRPPPPTSSSAWENESLLGTETELGDGGVGGEEWSELGLSLTSSSSSSSGAGSSSSSGQRRRDRTAYADKRRRGSSPGSGIGSSLGVGPNGEGLSELSLASPTLSSDEERGMSMSRVPTLLSLARVRQDPTMRNAAAGRTMSPSGARSTPSPAGLIDAHRFELLMSLSPGAISAGLSPLHLPQASTSPSTRSGDIQPPPNPVGLLLPPFLLSLLQLTDPDSQELLALLSSSSSTSSLAAQATPPPSTFSSLFLGASAPPPLLSSDSPSSWDATATGAAKELLDRVLSFGRNVWEEEEDEAFVLGRWKWREGWRGLVVGWAG